MSELSPPTRFFKLDTRDTTSVSTTYYAAYQDYENGKGGKAVLFVTNRDFDTGIVKASASTCKSALPTWLPAKSCPLGPSIKKWTPATTLVISLSSAKC